MHKYTVGKRVYAIKCILIAIMVACMYKQSIAQLNVPASYALIQRIVPKYKDRFIVQQLPANTNKDVFEIESRDSKIILRGNNGVAVASALYYYLTEYCHCQITWNGTNLTLPKQLPAVKKKIQKTTPYQYRYYLNYCTFNYSMSWWDWNRWQKEIDWMALHGINMPLALTGQEYTWYTVYKNMGFSDNELKAFFCGPAYFSWFWMGNLDGWGGPLPLSWMKSHKELQQKILQRERELGMKPVLQSFTGHVPASFQKHFPQSKLKQTNWHNGFADTYILDTKDPLFAEIGRKFIQEQKKLYGTDHLYSADTFNENEPPTDDTTYLAALSRRVYEAMHAGDSLGTWVMQGWLFYSDRKFWRAPQVKALLEAVPNDHMILLDLATEIEPVWKRTEAFYGKPWIWNMLNNFGGNVNLFGRMDGAAAGPASALHDPSSGRLSGIGLTMEAIEQNPVLYELMMDNTWCNQPIDIEAWLQRYIRNRYGNVTMSTLKAWQILKATVYNGKLIRDGAESILTGRPTFDSTTIWTRTKLNYPPGELLPAWDLLVQSADTTSDSDGFQYDLVDVTRQVLANYALPLQQKWINAYRAKDPAVFETYSNQFLKLASDMDALLATRKDFMLGPWIADARKWGMNDTEKAIYERNARDIITLWGDAASPLHEYANRQWSGLLNDFYKVRWEKFFTVLKKSLHQHTEPDLEAFEKNIQQWEWHWVNERKDYPLHIQGNSAQAVKKIYNTYRKQIGEAYQ
jgi:alpha-N-acetylglucosaminidase